MLFRARPAARLKRLGRPFLPDSSNFSVWAAGYNLRMPEWIGRTLGQVRIDALLAHGGMADVFLGTHLALQRQVAVKFLRAQYQSHPGWLERFQREARAVAMLRHPNIVQIYDYNVVDGQPYLVMEYLPGGALSAHLDFLNSIKRRLEIPIVSRLLNSLAAALQYAHSHGVVHRDIKPGNILLAGRSTQLQPGTPLPPDAEPVVSDFGLVRLIDASAYTAAGTIGGTPSYMSPEQASGEQADSRSDIYSLGVVVYELLAGSVPFDAESTVALLLKHIHQPPPPIPGLSVSAQRVLDRALAKEPEARFQTPSEFATAFDGAMHATNEASTFMGSALIPAPARAIVVDARHRSRPWYAAAAVGALMFALGAFMYLSDSQDFAPTPTGGAFIEPPPISLTGASALLPEDIAGVLRFQDGAAAVDKVTVDAFDMAPPPPSAHYEVWLLDEDARSSLGILAVAPDGSGRLSFVDSQSRNLLGLYSGIEITAEPADVDDPAPSGAPIYAFEFSARALAPLRQLLVSAPESPEQVGLIHGLQGDSTLLLQNAVAMLRAQQAGDLARARTTAESILYLLSGDMSEDHRDWDGDGERTTAGDGFGLISEDDRQGYLHLVGAQAAIAMRTPGPTPYMLENGEIVVACAENIEALAPQLREHLLAVIAATTAADAEVPVRAAVTVADRMQNGLDVDNDGAIEATPDECGVTALYEHAYAMADMPLLAVGGDRPSRADETPLGSVTPTLIGTVGVGTPTVNVPTLPVPSEIPTGSPLQTLLPTSLPQVLPSLIPTSLPQLLPSVAPIIPTLECVLLC